MFKRNFFKLIIVFVLSIVVFEQAYIPAAQASLGIGSAISGAISSVTTGQGGFYHAQGEDIYTLGYTRIRFNLTPGNTSLFTIQPPQFSMGCSGIDAMWGGFSMISGAQLEKILQNIISIAIPFAFNMALGVLCKQCEAIMNQIEAIANKLNGLNFNSCRTAQAAAGALSGMLNSAMSSGAGNSWPNAMSSVLGTTTGSATPTSASGGVEGALANFENAIPNSDCSQAKTGTDGAIQNIYNAISNCGQTKVAKMFNLGSLLRVIADHSNLGLTDGGVYGPGTGGYDDILGVIRGTLLGDVAGYSPVGATATSSTTSIVKYRSFPVVASFGNSNYLSTAYNMLLMGGSNINSVKISPATVNAKYIGIQWQSFYESNDTTCFAGFGNIYAAYLTAAYNNMYGTSVPASGAAYYNSTCPISVSSMTPTEIAQLVSTTDVPVLELLKMAYVNNDPSIIYEAALVVGSGAEIHWIKAILNGIDLNIYTYQNFNKSTKKSMGNYKAELAAFQQRALKVLHTFETQDANYKKSLNTLLAQLKTLNKDWVRQLSSAGLMGNYNFSKHLQ